MRLSSLWLVGALILSKGAEAASVTPIYSFTNFVDGVSPVAGLTLAPDGNFYGVTSSSAYPKVGSVFRLTPTGSLTALYSFDDWAKGAHPEAPLTLGSDGSLYGTTSGGGPSVVHGYGSVFKITTNGLFTLLHSFSAGNDGAYPYGGLVQGEEGNYYGTTSQGDPFVVAGYGTIFQVSSGGAFSTIYTFTNGVDGAYPYAGLVKAVDGAFYGVASAGGAKGYGSVFRLAPNGSFTPLYSFAGGSDGGNPSSPLVQAFDGTLYGTTANSATGQGTLFRVTTNGVLTRIHAFTGGNDGGTPSGGLTVGTDGNLYGTTSRGGSVGAGVAFRITPAGAFNLLYTFTGQLDGSSPNGALVQVAGGNFYGTARYNNGSAGFGAAFRLTVPPPAAPTQSSVGKVGVYITLAWNSSPGRQYQLQRRSDLGEAAWTNLGPASIATNALITFLDSPTNAQSFYRVYTPW